MTLAFRQPKCLTSMSDKTQWVPQTGNALNVVCTWVKLSLLTSVTAAKQIEGTLITIDLLMTRFGHPNGSNFKECRG